MIKKNRVDRRKNQTKVLKFRIANPLMTTREIEILSGIDHSTVSRIDKELQQIATKIPDIQDICKEDFEIVKLVQKETKRRLTTPQEESFGDIIRAGAESTKRYTLFKGNITDSNGGLKALSEFSESELLKIVGD